MKKKTYQQPEMKVVELEQTDIICTSPRSGGTEKYEEGDTDDWF